MVLASAAALAGVGYTLVRRSRSRSGALRSTRATAKRATATATAKRAAVAPRPDDEPRPTPVVNERTSWQDAQRISSAPDALDVALDLEGVFAGEAASDSELTARPHERVPAPRTSDDFDAPAPEDLGRAWLMQATESEPSLATADTLPDVEDLAQTRPETGKDNDADDDEADDDEADDDETTAEYVHKPRSSPLG